MSDNYRALTRTYRPRTFDDIVSQQHVSDTLKNAISQNRLAHAYMFCGPRGVGKTTMARVLARTVNDIEQQVDGESLNQTLNVIEIDAASNNGVDDIRDLRERVRIPPQNGRYKIYIIDEVHMLSKAAFNALLKTLEEPPDHVIFIFATTEPHKVLPTILSRVQRFDFKRISIDEIVSRLRNVADLENIGIDDESLHVIAKKADGALRDALGLLDQAIAFCGDDIEHEELLRALNVVSTERLFQFMETVEKHDAGNGIELINSLLQEGYDIQEFLVSLTEHLRNLYVAKNSAKMHLVEATPETKKRYRQASEAFTEDDLMRMLHIVSEAQYKIKEAHQPKIQFEITLLKLIHMERTRNLNALMAELEDLKKKLSNRPVDKAGSSGPTEPAKDTDAQTDAGAPDIGEAGEEEDVQSQSPSEDVAEPEQQHVPKTQPAAREPAKPQGRQPAGPSETSPSSSTSPGGNAETRAESEATEETGAEVDTAVAEEDEPAPAKENGRVNEEQEHEEDKGKRGEKGSYHDFFGNPSLGNGLRTPETGSNGKNAAVREPETAGPDKKRDSITLEELNSAWPEYIESLKAHVPQMLYFQMQRVDPLSLKNRELTLRCNDDFSKKIVEENKKQLSKVLEHEVGIFLRLNCTVHKNQEESEEESMSPYERFKALQKRDPKIKKLVELFGAELDYNLNQ